MNPIKLLFKLLAHFVPTTDEDMTKIISQGNEWYNAIRFDANVEEKDKNWQYWFKYYSEQWYVGLAMMLLYLYLRVAIA
jgi:hypothetical protein